MSRRHSNTNAWLVAACIGLICFVLGYFAGREHLQYQGRKMLEEIAEKWAASTGRIQKNWDATIDEYEKEIEGDFQRQVGMSEAEYNAKMAADLQRLEQEAKAHDQRLRQQFPWLYSKQTNP